MLVDRYYKELANGLIVDVKCTNFIDLFLNMIVIYIRNLLNGLNI